MGEGRREGRKRRFLQSGEWNGIVLSGAVINWAAAAVRGLWGGRHGRPTRGFVAGQREIELRGREREGKGMGAIKLRR